MLGDARQVGLGRESSGSREGSGEMRILETTQSVESSLGAKYKLKTRYAYIKDTRKC